MRNLKDFVEAHAEIDTLYRLDVYVCVNKKHDPMSCNVIYGT